MSLEAANREVYPLLKEGIRVSIHFFECHIARKILRQVYPLTLFKRLTDIP